MSSNKTANLQLNQWQAGDAFLRTEFNEDNAKVDAGMVALAKQKPYAFAEYIGNGAGYRAFDLGFRPSMVIFAGKLTGFASIGVLVSKVFTYGYLDSHGLTVDGSACQITDTGFVIKQSSYYNGADQQNTYIAFR